MKMYSPAQFRTFWPLNAMLFVKNINFGKLKKNAMAVPMDSTSNMKIRNLGFDGQIPEKWAYWNDRTGQLDDLQYRLYWQIR